MIYLDNAATSFPKPADCLLRGMEHYLELGASPGRGGYDRAMEVEAEISGVRQRLARFFGAPPDSRVCFTSNATDGLNLLLQGLAAPGDHVVSSRLEHNSVLRPLNHLQEKGIIRCDLVSPDAAGYLSPDTIHQAIRPNTRLVIINHGSNVLGTVQPIAQIGAICSDRHIPLLLDVAQTAGLIPIRMADWQVSGLAFTGHKSLLGPTGIGGVVLSSELLPLPTRFGGTGFDSSNPFQPLEFPSRLEAGTINTLGILCLSESLQYVQAHMADHFQAEMQLVTKLAAGLRSIKKVRLYGPWNQEDIETISAGTRLPLISCSVDGMSSHDVAAILDGDYDIAVRSGLHCAPLISQDCSAPQSGTVRFSPGPFTTETDIDAALAAMQDICR